MPPIPYTDYYFLLLVTCILSCFLGGRWSPFLPILPVTGFYLYYICTAFFYLSPPNLVVGGLSIDPAALLFPPVFFDDGMGTEGLANELAFLFWELAKKVETGS